MTDYKKMYAIMFNAATDALEVLGTQFDGNADAVLRCAAILTEAQTKCEALYIDAED